MSLSSPMRFKLLTIGVVLTLVFVGYQTRPALLERFALPLQDFKFYVRDFCGRTPVADPRIVIVAVDEKSINQVGRWPWDHRTMGELVRRLKRADLVGLDLVFADPTDSLQDQFLADAVAESGNVIAGFFFRSQATRYTSLADLDQLSDWAFRNVQHPDGATTVKEFPFVETNLPAIGASALAGGFFNGEPEIDGLYRRYPLALIHKGYLLPSLAMQMARYHLNQEAEITFGRQGVATFALGENRLDSGYLRLNYGLPEAAPYLSASDVLDGTIPPEYFRGKQVLIGITEIGIFDLRPTPVAPIIPGVWIHYTALSNLLTGNLLKQIRMLDLALIGAVVGLVGLVSARRRMGSRLVGYVLIAGGVLVTTNLLLMAGNLWVEEFYLLLPWFFLVITFETYAFFHTERRAGELRRAFNSYVSPEVVREILDNPEKLNLGGVEREITILFSDIRGFTTLSEKVSAAQLVSMLNRIHDPLTQVVLNQRGMLDKYIGDAMMALFNTPLELAHHPDYAVAAALEMVSEIESINQRFSADGLPRVDIGIGINTGVCIVGNMGSKVRFEYTAIGDAVNIASRLEGLCKVYKVRIVISEATRELLVAPVLLRQLDRVRVVGKQVPVAIYEVMVESADNQALSNEFAIALDQYWARDFGSAGEAFSRLADARGDATAILFAERCALYQEQPPPPEWDGSFTLSGK